MSIWLITMPAAARCCVAIACLLVASSVVRAQADSTAATRGLWITGSLGAAVTRWTSSEGGAAAAIAVDLQRGEWLASARQQWVGLGIGDVDIRAMSLLGGLASTSGGISYAHIAVGPSVVQRRDCTGGCGLFSDTPRELGPAHWGAGVAVEGDGALRFPTVGGAGLGLTAFANLNTARSFAGIGLELLLGRWR